MPQICRRQQPPWQQKLLFSLTLHAVPPHPPRPQDPLATRSLGRGRNCVLHGVQDGRGCQLSSQPPRRETARLGLERRQVARRASEEETSPSGASQEGRDGVGVEAAGLRRARGRRSRSGDQAVGSAAWCPHGVGQNTARAFSLDTPLALGFLPCGSCCGSLVAICSKLNCHLVKCLLGKGLLLGA